MNIIVATDIHGISAELRAMMEPVASGAIFLSPWETETSPIEDEHQAVSTFLSQSGLEAYADKISVAANRAPAYIIGFSVGASAAWLYSSRDDCNPESKATLFYGSRIRDYSSLVSRIDISAIFAEHEASFSPVQLARAITRANVRTSVETGTAHGFMNPRSANFAPALCMSHLQRLAGELARFRCSAQRTATT